MRTAGSGSFKASPARSRSTRGGLKIISFSKEGQPGPEITDFENPCALTFDPKGRLLVGGLNRHSQVWIYDVSGNPKKVDTFGAEGGIFSGEPGQYQPQKFHWIRGLGFDAAGNLYVAGVFGSWYNALIEAYSPRVNDSGTFTAWATGWTRPAPTQPMRTSFTPRRTSSAWTGAGRPVVSSRWLD